ncbi:MAG: hypothetical protein RL417_306 [Pseudomonadota bacterium]|jgi:plasmid replication initiation protein
MTQQNLIAPQRISSRDEMNLAEFPLTVLSTRANPGLKTLEFTDHIRGKNGELLERKWIITGADKFGLPTSSDDEVLLGLLKLTVDDGFRDRKIYFTRYELLKILRWTTEGRSYSRLQKALDRLSGVRIKATNAFYDNESKSHSTRNFGIVDAYEINDGRDTSPKPSFFIWSEVLFKSFQAGFIKKIDLEFYLDLQSAVSKRLYRYLDKHFWYKARVQVNLFTLAHEKIGISRNYAYASSLRQQLDPAVEELVKTGFLGGCEYIGKGKNTEVVFFAASAKPRVSAGQGARAPEVLSAEPENERPIRVTAAPASLDNRVAADLVARGLRQYQVDRLLNNRSPEQLERISKIVEHYDLLRSTNSPRISKSPIGFLYRAVENPEAFVLPNEGGKPEQVDLNLSGKAALPKPRSGGGERPSHPSHESEYLVARKRELVRLRETVEPDLLGKIRSDVEKALVKLKGSISPARFDQAVSHAVDEKLAKLFALPSFEEWLLRRADDSDDDGE